MHCQTICLTDFNTNHTEVTSGSPCPLDRPYNEHGSSTVIRQNQHILALPCIPSSVMLTSLFLSMSSNISSTTCSILWICSSGRPRTSTFSVGKEKWFFFGIFVGPRSFLWSHWHLLFRTSDDSTHEFLSQGGFIVAYALLLLAHNNTIFGCHDGYRTLIAQL